MSPLTGSALFCLHSALLAYNALIFNRVQRADNSQKRVHYHLHLSALHMTEGERSGAKFLLWEGGFSVGRTSLPLPLYCFISVAQPVCAAADTSRLKVQTNVMRADNGAYNLHLCLHALLIDNYCCPVRRKHTNGLKRQTQPLMGARRPEAAEKCPDAGRVAPIRAQCPGTTVLYMVSHLLFNLQI